MVPHFGYEHVRSRAFGQGADAALYFVGYVRDGLHGAAEVLASPLLLDDTGVHPSGGEVREAVEVLVYEALVVAEVEVGLSPVRGDVYLAVLVGAHGARVHVYVGVQLLRRDLEAARLQEPAQRGSRDALAESRYHTARDENVLCHIPRLPLIRRSLSGWRPARAWRCAGPWPVFLCICAPRPLSCRAAL